MLKKDTLKRIAGILKVREADLETAIKDTNEVDFVIDEKLSSFTEPELNTLKTNTYNDGKAAGVEIEIKEAKKKLNLDFTGKTIDGLLDAHKAAVIAEAKITPDKKVTELEGQVTTLKTTVADYEKKLAEETTKAATAVINSELYKYIPEPGENGPAIGKDEVITLLKANGYEVKNENGVFKAYKGDQLQQDKLGNPLPVKDVVTGFLTEKKLLTPTTVPGGRGGDDKRPPAKAMKMSELKKQFTDSGKSLNGEEFMKAAQEAAKDKDFDMNS
jgi:hypothetical protein